MKKILVGFLILFGCLVSINSFADYSSRIAQLEREVLIIKDQLAQYRQESERVIRVNEGTIAEKIGAIKELRRLGQEEKVRKQEEEDADREAKSHARPDSGGDTVERDRKSRGDSDNDSSKGDTPEGESPESRRAEEGQEGEGDNPSS